MNHKYLFYSLIFFCIILLVVGLFFYQKIFKVEIIKNEINLSNGLNFIINFNQPIIPSTVSIVLEPSLKEIKLNWKDQSRQLIITSDQLEAGVIYQLTINKGRSWIGTKIKDKSFFFRAGTGKDGNLISQILPLAELTEKTIEIDISSQRLKTWQDNKMLGEYPISTGKKSTPTKTGNFSVLSKVPIAYGCGQGQCWKMPYWIGVYKVGNEENGIHELPFINGVREGSQSLGYRVSHGCIRLPIGIAEMIYNWAEIGIPVNIHL